jgi:hypothetical protein
MIVTVRSLAVVLMLLLSACSQSGSLFGDMIIHVSPGVESRPGRLSVRAILPTEAFTQDWATALAAFHAEVAPARQVEEAAMKALEEARWEWDQAVAAPRGRHKFARTTAREWDLRAAEHRLVQARRRVWEVARTHDLQAVTVLDRHTAQLVQTDGTGHYVMAGLPGGPAYLYARVSIGGRSWIWFCPVRVRTGVQRVDLTDANSGGWPFVP